MRKIGMIILVLLTSTAYAQTKITWRTLEDVTFTNKYSEEVKAYFYYPTFGESLKKLDGKEVILRGYMLPLIPDDGFYILSANPYAACFFCGESGPESIVELKLKPGHPKFRMDQVVTIKGKLKLNRDDIHQCNYILERAEVYEE